MEESMQLPKKIAVAGATARVLTESGGLLPGPGAILADPTFEEWFNATY
jgi:hypothetical protein